MDGLVLLQKKLEDVFSLIQSFGPEDLVKAGKVWNNFSLQLQSIINFDLGKESPLICNRFDKKTNLQKCRNKNNIPSANKKAKKRKIANLPVIGESNAGENDNEKTIITPQFIKQSLKSDDCDLPSVAVSLEEKKSKEIGNDSDLQKERVPLSILASEEETSLHQESKNEEHAKEVEEVEIDTPSRLRNKQFICKECGAVLTTRGNFNVHLRKHSGERPFPCSKCSKRFNTSSNLRRHLLSHQGVKPYHCSYNMCDARFTERKSLVNHVRSHTKETPFECSICGKAYSTRWVLSQHSKTHAGPAGKVHLCHQCGKSFTQKSQLKLHEKRIHLCVKSQICSYCDMPFTTKSDLRRHEITHSGGKAFARHQKLKENLHDQAGKSENDAIDNSSESQIKPIS